jgi:large subunit ribosomal protein L30e
MSLVDLDKAISTAVKTGKVVLGAESAVKNAQTGKAKLIVVSANCPTKVRGDIEYYAELSGVKVMVYEGTSIDLGMVCKRPFTVSALTVKEAGDSDILKLIEQPSIKEEEEESAFGGFEEETETAEEGQSDEEAGEQEEEDAAKEYPDEDEED